MFDRWLRHRHRPTDEEIARELRDHLELDAEGLGASVDEAAASARRRFGNLGRSAEDTRNVWRWVWWDHVLRDGRIGVRALRRSPAFTAAAILILGLSIGAASAIFATYHDVVMAPLPVVAPHRLAVMWTERTAGVEFAAPLPDLAGLRHSTAPIQDVAGIEHFAPFETPFANGDRSLQLALSRVTANYFTLLGARAVLGRLLQPADGAPGAAPVLVLSYSLWQSRFGGSGAIIGRQLSWAYEPATRYRIVGVAPPGLDYPVGTGAWTAMANDAPAQVRALVRLAPGADPAPARAEYLSVVHHLDPEWKATRVVSESFSTAVVGNVRPVLDTIAVACALLLLIACVNIAGLFLVRAASRTREMAVRRALGAGVATLARQLLIESALVAIAGGVLGIACADWLIHLIVALAPAGLPRLDAVGLGGAPVGIAIAVTTTCVLIFGVAPAIASARGIELTPLRSGSRVGGATRRGHQARLVLVSLQTALALVMLVAGGLVGRSLYRLATLPLGFNADHLSILSVAFDAARYGNAQQRGQLLTAIERHVRAVHGVEAITPILVPPFFGADVWHPPFEAEASGSRRIFSLPEVPVDIAGAQYFRTLGIPILRGRPFSTGDDAHAPLVAVVSETVAHEAWPGQNPIGKRIRYAPVFLGHPDERLLRSGLLDWRTVVGVVPDTRYRALREDLPMIYLPWRQFENWQGGLAIRTSGRDADAAASIRIAIRRVDATLVPGRLQSLDELLGAPLARPRLGALLLTAFGVLALLLAATGLYGVMAYIVRERTREIGIRVALGATPGMIAGRVIREALVIIAIGGGVGMLGAFATTRLLGSLLFDVSPTDPATIGAACAVLAVAALLAAYLPARRAARVDPVRALHAD